MSQIEQNRLTDEERHIRAELYVNRTTRWRQEHEEPMPIGVSEEIHDQSTRDVIAQRNIQQETHS
jgi:hypothetical protein